MKSACGTLKKYFLKDLKFMAWNELSRNVFQFLWEARCSIREGDIILDAGAGQLRYRRFFDKCKRYCAIDFAKGDAGFDYSHLDAVADLAWLPLKEGSVDAIICTSVLEHVCEPFLVCKEFYRVLKKGGKIWLYTPYVIDEHQVPYDYFRYTRYGLKYILEKAGFLTGYIKPSNGPYLSLLSIFLCMAFRHIRYLAIQNYLKTLSTIVLSPIVGMMDLLDKEKKFPLCFFYHGTKP